jgi:hypothetical protein
VGQFSKKMLQEIIFFIFLFFFLFGFLKLPNFVGFHYCDLQLLGAVGDTVLVQQGAGCWDQF